MFVFAVLQMDWNRVILATNLYRDTLKDTSLTYRTKFHFCSILATEKLEEFATYGVSQDGSSIVLEQATIYVFYCLLRFLWSLVVLDSPEAVTHLRLIFPFHHYDGNRTPAFDLEQVDAIVIAKHLRKVRDIFSETRHRYRRRAESIYFEPILPVLAILWHRNPP